MQKWLLAAGAFIVGATLGMGLLAISVVLIGYIGLHRVQLHIPPFSINIGHWTVLAVPVISGALAAWWALRRLSQIQG